MRQVPIHLGSKSLKYDSVGNCRSEQCHTNPRAHVNGDVVPRWLSLMEYKSRARAWVAVKCDYRCWEDRDADFRGAKSENRRNGRGYVIRLSQIYVSYLPLCFRYRSDYNLTAIIGHSLSPCGRVCVQRIQARNVGATSCFMNEWTPLQTRSQTTSGSWSAPALACNVAALAVWSTYDGFIAGRFERYAPTRVEGEVLWMKAGVTSWQQPAVVWFTGGPSQTRCDSRRQQSLADRWRDTLCVAVSVCVRGRAWCTEVGLQSVVYRV